MLKQPGGNNKKQSCLHQVRKNWDLYLLLLPGVLWFLAFAYKPMAGLAIAFYDYNISREAPSWGWTILLPF